MYVLSNLLTEVKNPLIVSVTVNASNVGIVADAQPRKDPPTRDTIVMGFRPNLSDSGPQRNEPAIDPIMMVKEGRGSL